MTRLQDSHVGSPRATIHSLRNTWSVRDHRMQRRRCCLTGDTGRVHSRHRWARLLQRLIDRTRMFVLFN
uniref:Uncharacterized protein n=1 Tax=Vitis vinifera TaxID=29760 RepID=F6HFF9_VITVI